MKRAVLSLTFAIVAAYCCFGNLNSADAQGVIWGGEAEKYFRPGAYLPNDGQPWSERYGYSTAGSFWYPFSGGITGNQLNYLDYYDRLDRAYKYGYQVPNPPEQTYHGSSRPRVGLGLGYFRFR